MATVITSRSESVFHYLNPIAMVRNLWQHRDLITQFTKREIEGRYKGSFLGLFWSFINPLTLLLIYTFVFGIVLQSKWPSSKTDNLAEFAIVIFSGLIIFTIFSDSVGRAPTTILNVPNYVKKVVFPLEIIPVSIVGASLFHGLISIAILIIANLLVNQNIPLTIFLIPILLLPLVLLCLGLTWFISSLGVFIRDINYTISLIVQVTLYLTPVFYPLSLIKDPFTYIIFSNPLTNIVESFRSIVLWGSEINWISYSLWLGLCAIISLFGYAWFMKTKKAFADVI